jgi:transposase-like protein
MRREIEAFREEVQRRIGSARSARARRYGPELRQKALGLVARWQAPGVSRAEAARRLGLPCRLLYRWLAEAKEPRGLLPVRVGADEASRPVLVTPAGYRVEGLREDELVELLRALG